MKERFTEENFDSMPAESEVYRKDQEIRENIEERKLGFQFDRMVYDAETAKKLNAVETFNDLKDSLSNNPDNAELAHLKERVVDPLSALKVYQTDRILQEKTRDLFEKRYQDFFVPGYVHYDFREHAPKVARPSGISCGLQELMLKKAGLLKEENQIKYYANPPKGPKNGLVISPGPDGLLESPTMALFDTLRRLGFYNRLGPEGKKELLADAIFAEIVERNEWLEGANRNFYDENDMTLFKINRLLPTETLTAMLKEMTSDVKSDPRDFVKSKKEMREKIFIAAAASLSTATIKKYGLDEKDARGKSIIEKQKESVMKSREYLKENRNATEKSNIGRVIYVRSEEGGQADKLPGGLPAIASEAPKNKKGVSEWRQPNGYFEVLNTHLLGFVRKGKLNGLTDVLAKETAKSGLNLQVTPIEDWVKIFISFRGQPTESVVAAFEKNVFEKKPRTTTKL